MWLSTSYFYLRNNLTLFYCIYIAYYIAGRSCVFLQHSIFIHEYIWSEILFNGKLTCWRTETTSKRGSWRRSLVVTGDADDGRFLHQITSYVILNQSEIAKLDSKQLITNISNCGLITAQHKTLQSSNNQNNGRERWDTWMVSINTVKFMYNPISCSEFVWKDWFNELTLCRTFRLTDWLAGSPDWMLMICRDRITTYYYILASTHYDLVYMKIDNIRDTRKPRSTKK